MSKSSNRQASELIQQIEKRYRKLNRKRFFNRLLIAVAILLLGTALLTWLEQQAYFSSTIKMVWLAMLLGTGIAVAVWRWRRESDITLSDFYASLSDGIRQPALKHALDLSLKSRDSHLKLYESAIKKNLESVSWDEIKPRINQQVKRMPAAEQFRRLLGGVAAAGLLLLISAFVRPGAFQRTAQFWNDYQKPNPYTFTITPGSTTLEQGSQFQPTISFEGAPPEELLLGLKTEVEENFRFRPLRETEEGTFQADPVQLSSNASYFIRMGEFSSEQFSARVQLRPRFESLSVEIFPPQYTGLDSTRVTYPFSQVKAYQGSKINIVGRTNKPVKRLSMITSPGGDTLVADGDGRSHVSFTRTVTHSDTLAFSMEDSSGLKNSNPFTFTIDAEQDELPFIELLNPTENITMSTPAALDLTYRVSDDFGVTSASLHYEIQRAFVEQPETGTIDLGSPQMNSEFTYTWDVPSLNPKPRDVITFWLQATDNDRYNGLKSSQSRKLTITLPSLVENIENIDRQETEVQQSLENVAESFEQMQEEYDRFRQNLQRNPETNYEQKQMLEEVQEKQDEIDKQVEELNKKFEKIRREITKNDLVSEETRRAYKELQQLMKEIDDPQLQEALEKLQQSLGNLNQQQLRKALENYEFNEQQYQERLKRTLELFKSLKMNSDLEKMATALEDLAEKEKELSNSEAPAGEQAEQQEAIQNETEKLSRQLQKLDKNTPEQARKKIQKLQQESQQELDSVQQQLQQNIEQLRKQQQDNSGQQQNQQNQNQQRQQQQQIQQQFQKLSQKMRNAKQQFSQQRMQVNMAALQNILYNLINLSEEQEELTQSTEYLASRSQAFVEKARIEQNIRQQFVQLSDSLFQVSSEIPGFSNRINTKKMEIEQSLQRAVNQLSERSKSQSTYAQRESLGGINELSSMIASLLDQLQNQQQNGMGGGMSMQQFMKQMQNMSGKQQQLNQQIQNLINDIQGERLTRDQIERLNQMARQQNQIRKQLQNLQKNGGLEAGDKLMSELQRMAEEMEKTINDLRGGQTDGELVKRQQNILSRMLSAEKAVQERGKKDEREGTTAEEAPRSVPPDMTLEELQTKMRNLLNDPNKTQFSEDYQRLIEQYFQLLKEQRETGPSR